MTLKSSLGSRWRAARARFRGCAIVLAYHRVADLPSDPQLIGISPERFSEQMSVLAREHETLSCGDLFALMREGKRLPQRAVVVTIDDGYADNISNAFPILREHGIPATAFLSSSFVDGSREFWWDELEGLILGPGRLPALVRIGEKGSLFSGTLPADLEWGQAESLRWAGWNVTQAAPTARHELFLALYAYIRPLSTPQREAALAQLREAASVSASVRPLNRTLTADEVRELDRSGVFEIGSHTRTHQALSARSESEQRDEIMGDKKALEVLLGHDVQSLCYPHGGRDRYDDISVRLAREAGFAGACTTQYGIVFPWADRYTLPRCHTENIDGPGFRTLLNGWFDAGR